MAGACPRPDVANKLRYRQGDAIVDYVTAFARSRRARSLLDIGAGGLETALKIAGAVADYVAIEENSRRAAALRNAGLDVIEAHFPTPLPASFDLVVCSHSIPEGDVGQYDEYFSAGLNAVRPGGTLLIITFKGSTSGVFALRHDVDTTRQELSEIALVDQQLSLLGQVNRDSFFSYATATHGNDIVDYFEPWLIGAGCPDSAARREIRRALAESFGSDNNFAVPVEHTVRWIDRDSASLFVGVANTLHR